MSDNQADSAPDAPADVAYTHSIADALRDTFGESVAERHPLTDAHFPNAADWHAAYTVGLGSADRCGFTSVADRCAFAAGYAFHATH